MDPRIEKLISVFESNGWAYKGLVDMSDWWYSDILELSSTWRPVNVSIYLTLLTDPQMLDKKIVWAVGISSKLPADKHADYIAQVTLSEINKIQLKEMVSKINEAVLQ